MIFFNTLQQSQEDNVAKKNPQKTKPLSDFYTPTYLLQTSPDDIKWKIVTQQSEVTGRQLE